MSGCGARTAAGSLEAVFESSDVERFAWVLKDSARTHQIELVAYGFLKVDLPFHSDRIADFTEGPSRGQERSFAGPQSNRRNRLKAALHDGSYVTPHPHQM